MGTIDTYLKEYGNYTFQEEEFNEVDAIIFSLLSYANLLDIVPESKKEKILWTLISSIIRSFIM